jgi:dTDP-L-rhamnose 4-epimerase
MGWTAIRTSKIRKVLVQPSVLITGGAGFIGCALAHRLVSAGYDVVVMDVLHPQIHTSLGRPSGLPVQVQLLTGDVTHAADWDAVLRLVRPSQIVHLAAETGTGQSLSEATRHASVNVVGTAQLLDALTRTGLVPDQLVLASSRAVYGEGAWRCGEIVFYPGPRTHTQLVAGLWDPVGPDGGDAESLPSSSGQTEAHPTNIYAATKLTQENMLLAWATAHGNALSVLRLQNVYGPGQSQTNPYTGIVTLFAQLARAQRPLPVYEDGRIVRDFVFIEDVVESLAVAVEKPAPRPRLLDIGSGVATTIHDLACRVAELFDSPEPTVVHKFRDGDVRAASCEIGSAMSELSWQPSWSLENGLRALLSWMDGQAEVST